MHKSNAIPAAGINEEKHLSHDIFLEIYADIVIQSFIFRLFYAIIEYWLMVILSKEKT